MGNCKTRLPQRTMYNTPDEWKINNIQFCFQEQGTKPDYGAINA